MVRHGRRFALKGSSIITQQLDSIIGPQGRWFQANRFPLWLVMLGISFPTISTYIYFDLLSNAAPSLQKGAYFSAKLFQFVILGAALLVRYGKLAPGWLSHAMVDAAIFAVGYLLLFQ